MFTKVFMRVTALAIALPLSSASALGLSVSLGGSSGVNADVSIGGGSGSGNSSGGGVSASVGVGGNGSSGGGISADVGIGGNGSTNGGITASVDTGSGPSTGGGVSTGGGGSGDTDINVAGAPFDGTQPLTPVSPSNGALRVIGAPVWTSDEYLVGVITSVDRQSNDQVLVSVQTADAMGLVHPIVRFQVSVRNFENNQLKLPQSKSQLIDVLS